MREIALRDVACERVRTLTPRFSSACRDIVSGAGQISDLQARRRLHIHTHRAIDGRPVERIRPQPSVAHQPVAFLILFALIFGNRGDRIFAGLHRAGSTEKVTV